MTLELYDQRLPQSPLVSVGRARPRRRADLLFFVAAESRNHDNRPPLIRPALGPRANVDPTRGQLPPARTLSLPQQRGKYCRSRRRIDVYFVYGDDVHNQIKR